jgi:spore maturation protein CgeB
MPFGANPHTFLPRGSETERAFCFIGACYGARARAIARLAQANVPIRVYGRSPAEIYGDGVSIKSLPALRALFAYRDGWQRVAKSLKFSAGRACIRGALKRTFQNAFLDLPEKHPEAGDIEYCSGPSYEDLPGVYGRTSLSLGSTELASTFVLKKPLYFVRFREFEAAMSGAAHVVNRSTDIEEYYEADREMIFYDSFDELVDKGRFWLNPKHDTARQKIREAARARSVGEHTWTHRFQRLFDELGIPTTV